MNQKQEKNYKVTCTSKYQDIKQRDFIVESCNDYLPGENACVFKACSEREALAKAIAAVSAENTRAVLTFLEECPPEQWVAEIAPPYFRQTVYEENGMINAKFLYADEVGGYTRLSNFKATEI